MNDILDNNKIKIDTLFKKNFKEEMTEIWTRKNTKLIKKILQTLSLIFFLKRSVYRIYNKLTKYDINRFLNHKIREKSVLITDINDCHGEVLGGLCYYFLKLNYNVDVLITNKKAKEKPLSMAFNKKINVFSIGISKYIKAMQSKKINEYDYIVFASEKVYFESDKFGLRDVLDFIESDIKKEKIIFLNHHIDKIDDFKKKEYKNFALKIMSDKDIKTLNCCYFGKNKKRIKNKKTKFIIIGSSDKNRRNTDLVKEALQKLKRDDFEISIIGKADFFDKRVKTTKKRLNYNQMYKKIKNADYILPLLDSNILSHKRYINSAVLGSFQLSLGLNVPIIIEKTFAFNHGFNSDNAIVYENGKFLEAFIMAIEKNQRDYNELLLKLEDLKEKITNESLNNLKTALYLGKTNDK